MVGVTDVVGYLRTLARAKAQTDSRRWVEAAALWQRVVEVNPTNGNHWDRLAEARFEHGDFGGALAAYGKVRDLGLAAHRETVFPSEVAYRIACCQARLGDVERSAQALTEALDLGYRDLDRAAGDEHLAPLRTDGRLAQLLGLSDVDGLTRDEGWRADLRFFAREVKRRAYPQSRHRPAEEFDAAVEQLSREVPTLSDAHLLVRLAELLATLGDGHAFVEAPEDDAELHRTLPVQFYLFEEGLYVTAAAEGQQRLLGAQVLEFAGTPVERAVAAVERTIGRDNEHGPRAVVPWRLVRTAVLHALAVVGDPATVALTVRLADGTTAAIPLAAQPAPATLSQALPCPSGWRFLPESLDQPLPLYLRNCGASYWFEHQPADGLTYVQFNRVADDPDEPLSAFVERLFSSIVDNGVDRLVVDLRWNGGGNTFLAAPLLHRLIGCERVNRKGGLFVIVGRSTFSAAQNIATLIGNHTHALFVGEPTGSRPNFVGETVPFRLPYSRFEVNVSDLYWQTSWPMDHRSWIAPDLYAPPTFAAFAANRDPAMEAILACGEHLPGW